ncbi:MAG: hypothetical protein COX62_03575 [Deltaproteobacteria bacterium CG_4_10_14_0_2_um_filter_43_8]|nr:MAG: hypothetical protein COV46_03975 [Deltaproteobacteria bacterium CG11_big_fil_rev_8_21_14_0_20_49_13]PJA21021.1 MAG: hypothetical protein COX62_03575 [Deltaproteobacteria bacterium CG_4_10_14_0_2_um_filter_43_8]
MKKIIIFLFIILVFSACKKTDLYHDLSEEEANEMLVVLQKEGVDAVKVKDLRQNEVFWTVQVDPKKMNLAQRIISEHHLPRKRELGLSGVYKEKGLIPTPDEQKARYLLALKGEIINSIMKIPEVVDADVVLNIPSQDEFADPKAEKKRPSASVVIKARPSDIPQDVLSESKIQQFVANAVENMNPRNVAVIVTYISSPKRGLMPGQSLILSSTPDPASNQRVEDSPVTRIAGLEVVSSSQSRLKIYLAIFFIVLAVLAAALIITVIRTSRTRSDRGDGAPGERPMIEGKVVEGQPRLKDGR